MIMNINLIRKLSGLANTLDRKGFYKEASYIDDIIKISVNSPAERPQSTYVDGEGTRGRTPSDKEEWPTGDDTGTKPRRPSNDARLVALKSRLSRLFRKKYDSILTEKALQGILSKFGLIDVDISNGLGNEQYFEIGNYLEDLKHGDENFMAALNKENKFPQRLSDGKCISCGEETGSDYLEQGEDIVSSPVCDSCLYEGLGEEEEAFLRERGLLGNLATMRETPTDPGTIEENYSKPNDYFTNDPSEIMPELIDKKRSKPKFPHPDDEGYYE